MNAKDVVEWLVTAEHGYEVRIGEGTENFEIDDVEIDHSSERVTIWIKKIGGIDGEQSTNKSEKAEED